VFGLIKDVVGLGGANRIEDVRVVQLLLNLTRGSSRQIEVDGRMGCHTMNRLNDFQFREMSRAPIGMKMDPKSTVIRALTDQLPIKLTGSVGKEGRNAEVDVKVVQTLLNLALKGKLKGPLVIDGKAGRTSSRTIDAILMFQRDLLNARKPDGRIDVGGKTLNKLLVVSGLGGDSKLGGKESVLKKIIPAAPVATGLTSLSPELFQDQLRKKITEYEGRVPFIYLDSVGLPTIGEGHLIAKLSDALEVKFINESGRVATADEIKEDYMSVLSAGKKLSDIDAKNMGYKYYKRYTKLTVQDVEIDRLTKGHIASFERKLKAQYPQFGGFPDNVKYALFDMIFNLGPSGLKNKFPKFNKAIKENDWATAADESHRTKIQEPRNTYVYNLLKSLVPQM